MPTGDVCMNCIRLKLKREEVVNMCEEKSCRSCSYYSETPVGIFPSEICTIHIKWNFDTVCDDYTTSRWVKLKRKIGLV